MRRRKKKTEVEIFKERSEDGTFVRQPDSFRDWVTRDGSSGYPAAPNRYHLYVSLACPWAHRTVIVRRLKRLEGIIGMTVVDPLRDERGWAFTNEPDPVNGFRFLMEAYRATDPTFNGRATVPVLWDKVTHRIVSNSDEDLMRMFNSEFDDFTDSPLDLYPEPYRTEIDALNDFIYPNVNDGVYRAGFAATQEAYDLAVRRLFEALDWLETRLSTRRYLVGDVLTEADWKLFPTLVRFDAVYVTHFKCNLRRLVDYPNLYAYARDLYQQPGIAETVNFDHIKRHYYMTHPEINPTRIVPIGFQTDFTAPHGRDQM